MEAEKKKPGLALVVGMGKPKAAPEAEEGESEESGEFDVAAGELFEAIKSGDEDAFKAALRAVKSC